MHRDIEADACGERETVRDVVVSRDEGGNQESSGKRREIAIGGAEHRRPHGLTGATNTRYSRLVFESGLLTVLGGPSSYHWVRVALAVMDGVAACQVAMRSSL